MDRACIFLAAIAISNGASNSIDFNGAWPLVDWNVHDCINTLVVVFGLLRVLRKVGQAGINDEQDADQRSC